MAGQRMYYSNILTTTRGEVRVPLKLLFHPGSTAAQGPYLLLLAGHGLTTTAGLVPSSTAGLTVTSAGFTSTNGGIYNAFTLNWPEKYGKCVYLDCISVQQAVNDTAFPILSSDFVAGTATTTSQTQISMVSVTSTALLGVATTTPTLVYTIYVEGVFELGM